MFFTLVNKIRYYSSSWTKWIWQQRLWLIFLRIIFLQRITSVHYLEQKIKKLKCFLMRMTGFTSAINSNANLSGRPSTEHTSAPWSLSFAWPYLIGITKILKNSLVWNSNHPSRAMEVVAALEINTSDIPDSSIVDFHDAALENPRKCRFFWTSGAPDWVQTVGSVAGAPDLTRLRRLGGLGGRVAATCTVQSRLPPPQPVWCSRWPPQTADTAPPPPPHSRRGGPPLRFEDER